MASSCRRPYPGSGPPATAAILRAANAIGVRARARGRGRPCATARARAGVVCGVGRLARLQGGGCEPCFFIRPINERHGFLARSGKKGPAKLTRPCNETRRQGAAVIRKFANFFGIVARETIEAGRRIRRQSPGVARFCLRLKRYHRRYRSARARLQRREPGASGPPCEWQPRQAKYGRLFWVCEHCGQRTLKPATPTEQRRAGVCCPCGPLDGVANGAN